MGEEPEGDGVDQVPQRDERSKRQLAQATYIYIWHENSIHCNKVHLFETHTFIDIHVQLWYKTILFNIKVVLLD